jgi:serine/threonine protein kinase
MVTELMEDDVRDMKTKMPELMKEKEARDIFKQMLEAIASCHQNNIIHRDVKLDNFLVKSDKETGERNVKLADFGIACKYDPENPPVLKCGTKEYVAPEVISAPHYDTKVDCYSLGIILFELLSQFETL